MLAALALAYLATLRVWPAAPGQADADGAEADKPLSARRALGRPAVRLHIAAFFVLAGAETTAGQRGYTVLTESRGLDPTTAGVCVGAFWTLFTLGRVAAGAVVLRVGTLRLARFAAAGAAAGALLYALAPANAPLLGAAGLCFVGLALGPLFPGLMAGTPRWVGAGAAAHAVGFQVAAAVVGAAALPAAAGGMAGVFGLEAVAAVLAAASVAFLALYERLVAAAGG